MMSVEEVASDLGVSTRTIDRMVRAGKFPKPIRLSAHCVRWPAAAVDEYLQVVAE
jgi:prophage regulatory protein